MLVKGKARRVRLKRWLGIRAQDCSSNRNKITERLTMLFKRRFTHRCLF